MIPPGGYRAAAENQQRIRWATFRCMDCEVSWMGSKTCWVCGKEGERKVLVDWHSKQDYYAQEGGLDALY